MKFAVFFQDGDRTIVDLPRAPVVGQTIEVGLAARARVDVVIVDEIGSGVIEATRLFGVGAHAFPEDP
jgi:hypothetical protein